MGHKAEDQTQKVRFYDEVASEWDLGNSSEIISVEKLAEGFQDVQRGAGGTGIGKRNAQDYRSSVMKELRKAKTWFYKEMKNYL